MEHKIEATLENRKLTPLYKSKKQLCKAHEKALAWALSNPTLKSEVTIYFKRTADLIALADSETMLSQHIKPLIYDLDNIVTNVMQHQINRAQAMENLEKLDWQHIGDRSNVQAVTQVILGIIIIVKNMINLCYYETIHLKNKILGKAQETDDTTEEKRQKAKESISFGAYWMFGIKNHLKAIVYNLANDNDSSITTPKI